MVSGVDLGDFGRDMVERQVRKRFAVLVEPAKDGQLGPPQDARPGT